MLNGFNGFGARPDVYGDPEFGDHPGQQRAPALVDLLGHQSRHHLDDVCLQPELAQRIRSLESQQSATDHHPRIGVTGLQRALGTGADGVEVVKRAIHMARGQVVAGNRWDESIGAGGQHQGVVADALAVGGDHRLCGAVDFGDAGAQQQANPLVTGVIVAGQCQQVAVPALGIGGQANPVVCRVGFLRQNRDPPGSPGVTGTQGLDQPVAHHAVAHHNDVTGSTVRARNSGWEHEFEGTGAKLQRNRKL